VSQSVAHAEPVADATGGWADAAVAAALVAVDPWRLGGIVLRGRPGPVRDRVIAWIRDLSPVAAPMVRVPLHVTEDRLLGGISLADSLHHGKLVREQGLLARCDGGIAVLPMAERLEPHVVSHVSGALDRAVLLVERDATSARVS
jgi:magnesium chelatase subunit D